MIVLLYWFHAILRQGARETVMQVTPRQFCDAKL